MPMDDVLFNKLKLKDRFVGDFNVLIGERIYYLDEALDVVAVRHNRDTARVEPGVNLYDDFIKHQPIALAYINDKKYCMSCGGEIRHDDILCRQCSSLVNGDGERFTIDSINNREIRVSRVSQDVYDERANIVRYLVESPLVTLTEGCDTLEFKIVEDVRRHFNHGDCAWRFKAIANSKYFRNMVSNLNIDYRFGIDNASSDLVKFLKTMEVRLDGITANDDVIQLDESMVQQLRYSYVMNNSVAKNLMHDMINIGPYPDDDFESFCQAIPMLVDNGVIYVTRSGSVEYDMNKLINIKKKDFKELMTVDGYTPSVNAEVQFEGYYESTGTWYNV